MEELVPIPGYEGLYSITKKGRVFSHTCDTFLRTAKLYGYPIVCLYKNGHAMNYSIQTLLKLTKED